MFVKWHPTQNLPEVLESLPLPMGTHHSTLYQNFINFLY